MYYPCSENKGRDVKSWGATAERHKTSPVKIVCLEGKRPCQQFFCHVGTEPTLPGFNQFCRVNVSCSRTQHGAACGGRTQDLSTRSPMLYHYATALQTLTYFFSKWGICETLLQTQALFYFTSNRGEILHAENIVQKYFYYKLFKKNVKYKGNKTLF